MHVKQYLSSGRVPNHDLKPCFDYFSSAPAAPTPF
ncbi:MAG: hypothetical protein JWQ43_2145 [Glaciihabitans sp.]|nr:hypothetical protein [Glaciihabitans sp.]